MAVAFVRRWQQIRHARQVHALRRTFRPLLAKALAGSMNPAGIQVLQELPLADLELLFDPLFSKRKLSERQLVFLQALCVELGLVGLWQSRLVNGTEDASLPPLPARPKASSDRAVTGHLLRAKSIRNLGKLRHRPSWPLFIRLLDDGHTDIQLETLRALASLGAPESFAALRDRLHAILEKRADHPPLPAVHHAMARFRIDCAPELMPSLRHPDHQVRLHAMEVLRTMVRRAAAQSSVRVTPRQLTPALVDLLLDELAADTRAEVRAAAAEAVVLLAHPHGPAVVCNLLRDRQWIVRHRALHALAQISEAALPFQMDLRDSLCDSHGRVREAAIHALLTLGEVGKRLVYEHFLTFPDAAMRAQILEIIERTGLMSALVEDYSEGKDGLGALIVEQLANDPQALGLSGVLRTVDPAIRQRFLDRFLPHAEPRVPSVEALPPGAQQPVPFPQTVELQARMAA